MLKSANLLHKCGLGDSDMSSTVLMTAPIWAFFGLGKDMCQAINSVMCALRPN